ncbi:5-formyltetrahydrofolate cyclo-ligase [Bacillus shivajii]|uniref:5-formyltetrahydrofolate cyclo-ligase n=1 Tax=Bacillus shivajii TaxID=1983719 RepID=UPI001CFAA733|nr:5-formyltetrahydrofolate cyclo-ligase [Bacillus shivajii]UCZ54550.1 5-formyltetrahydrofolate cyclo-ligase [Bacillus shivajii]
MNKKSLRKEMKNKYNTMSNEERKTRTIRIHNQLLHWEGWKASKIVGTTVSVGNEVDTYELIKNCWEEGKLVVVPKCEPNGKQLHFYKLTSFDQLEDSFYGLKEPNPNKCERIQPTEISLLIVPGLFFDKNGYRVGYGGGYYDRFLSEFQLKTCALCYDFQILEYVPYEKHDIPVETLVSESIVIPCM